MSIKVLVADDSITIQKVIGIIFGGSEYSLSVVNNGKSAVDKAREINPDILLIDALMPGMSGYEVAEAVRSIPALATKPILIMTGSFEPFDEEKAKKCGADDFIAKPFESQQIITKVKELLELGSSRTLSTLIPLAPEISTPPFDSPPAAPADIWGAFTPETGPSVQAIEAPVEAPPVARIEPDVFAIVTEEMDAQLVQNPITPDIPSSTTGSQWVPVEENTFEFEEEAIPEPSHTFLAEQIVPVQEASFGEIAFEDDIATSAPTYSSPAFKESNTLESVSSTETAAPTVTLTEEQLKAAITAASKEVIERIVWEIVPDLAEVMIREAIRKIKEAD